LRDQSKFSLRHKTVQCVVLLGLVDWQVLDLTLWIKPGAVFSAIAPGKETTSDIQVKALTAIPRRGLNDFNLAHTSGK
jgi:hypothetical protein